jgi:hypothetical protein
MPADRETPNASVRCFLNGLQNLEKLSCSILILQPQSIRLYHITKQPPGEVKIEFAGFSEMSKIGKSDVAKLWWPSEDVFKGSEVQVFVDGALLV